MNLYNEIPSRPFVVEDLINMIRLTEIKVPKKIKCTSKFYEYIESVCVDDEYKEPIDTQTDGIIGRLDAIPIEIDDTIENEYYELVYEEN